MAPVSTSAHAEFHLLGLFVELRVVKSNDAGDGTNKKNHTDYGGKFLHARPL